MTSTRGQDLAFLHRERRRLRVRAGGRSDEGPIVEQAHADEAGFGRDEGLHVGGVALGDGPGAVDVVVGDDQHAASLGLRIGRDADGVVDVQRPVGAERRRRPHRAGEHDRLVGLHDQVEEVGGLFHRVGAVRDGHAVDIRLGGQLVHFGGELDPHLVVHVLAADGGDLHAAHVGEGLHLRHGLDQHVHGDRARLVAGRRGRFRGAGDGAAGGDDDDPRLRRGLRVKHQRRDHEGGREDRPASIGNVRAHEDLRRSVHASGAPASIRDAATRRAAATERP